MTRDEFIEKIIDDSYITWLSDFVNKWQSVDVTYFTYSIRVDSETESMIGCLTNLIGELTRYVGRLDLDLPIDCFYLKYNNVVYTLYYNGTYTCEITHYYPEAYVVNYEDFRNNVKELYAQRIRKQNS